MAQLCIYLYEVYLSATLDRVTLRNRGGFASRRPFSCLNVGCCFFHAVDRFWQHPDLSRHLPVGSERTLCEIADLNLGRIVDRVHNAVIVAEKKGHSGLALGKG